jgi:hypothetical protein
MMRQMASARGVTLPDRALAAVARPVLAGSLRMLPFIFGERGRGHADWRSSYWIPAAINEASKSVRARRGGIVWNLDLRDLAQRSLYYTGYCERSTGRLLAAEFKDGDIFADVGAHIGIHALPAAKQLTSLGGHVFAFEPGPDSIKKIEAAAKRRPSRQLHGCADGARENARSRGAAGRRRGHADRSGNAFHLREWRCDRFSSGHLI